MWLLTGINNNLMFDANYKYWLGGFVEGEGSLVVSIVKYDKAIYGILLQPEFNVAQHVNGLSVLKNFKVLFNNKGQIYKKSGSSNVWVYSLKGIDNLSNYLVPYFLEFVVPYSSKYKKKEFNKFLFILEKLRNKSKFEKEEFINIIKLVYELNPEGKGKKRKRTLSEVIDIIEYNNINK